MDFNGDYPGSRVKRLKVDTTADIGTDLTVGGDATITGDVAVQGDISGGTFTPSTVLTGNGSAALPAHSFSSLKTLGMYKTGSNNLGFAVNGTEKFEIRNTASETISTMIAPSYTFKSSPLSTISYNTTTSAVEVLADGFLTGSFDTSKFSTSRCEATTVVATTSTLGTATATTLTVSGTSSLGSTTITSMTASSVTSSDQLQTIFASTAATSISNTSFTLYNGWATTPSISRGSPAVTVSGSTFTINATGYYDVGFQIMWAANATGQRSATMRINGAPTNFAYDIRNAVTGGFVTSNMGSMRRYLTAGDTIAVEVWQNSGGSLNIQNNGNQIIGMSFMRVC